MNSRTSNTVSAIARADELYRANVPKGLFVERLAKFLRHGFVVNQPDLFAMGCPSTSGLVLEGKFGFDPIDHQPPQIPDTWYIDLAVGDLRKLVSLLPYELPSVCFYRKFQNKLKIYPMNRFLSRCQS